MKLRHLHVLLALLLTVCFAPAQDSPAPPTDPASAMFTLQDLWNRLSAGTAGVKRPGAFAEPGVAPGSKTMRTLDELMLAAPALDDGSGATAAQVLAGRTFWGLRSGGWGLLTGTLAAGSNVSGGNGLLSFSIPDGAYSGRTATAADTNLATANIKAGVAIFGVTGKTEVVDTTTGTATAAQITLGEKAWVKGVEVTGSLVAPAANSVTFSYNGTNGTDGSVQTWTVPASVTTVTIECWGAQGGIGAGGAQGGVGGYAKGTRAVTPGDVLSVYVGGQDTSGVGGWNGGGPGYFVGGGGGGTDVRVDPAALGNRIIVAGGGGGGGRSTGAGGGAGGLGGGGGGSSSSDPGGGRGGGGASDSGGGVGGLSGCSMGYGSPGGGGSFGVGGGGSFSSANEGGGGGGGWYGGGGGGSSSTFTAWAGGGGGGSNHVDSAMTAPLMGNLGNTGHGKVVISW